MKGGKPCGLAPWDSPPRYAVNSFNRRRFRGAPWHGAIPTCPPRKTSKKRLPPPKMKAEKRLSSSPRKVSSESESEETMPASEFPHFIISHGKEIGRGRESVVYAYKGKAVKIYDSNFKRANVQQNIDFLVQNRESGVVPRIYGSSVRHGWIEMELLTNYQTLKSTSTVRQKSKEYRKSLLDALKVARSRLPPNVEYKDLKNLRNIAVRLDSAGKLVTSVKFYEGGAAVYYHDKLRGRQYIADMAAELNMKKYYSFLKA